jgi:hypothetical protein
MAEVHIGWRYVRYTEGAGRSLTLSGDWSVDGAGRRTPELFVPGPRRWRREMPDWARERRAEILAVIAESTAHMGYQVEEY